MRIFNGQPLNFFLRIFLICFFFNIFVLFLNLPNSFSQDSIANSKNTKPSEGRPIIVDADDVEYLDTMIIGKGNVKIDYDGVLLKADQADVDMKSKGIVAQGNVCIEYEGISLFGEKLEYDFNTRQGYFEKSTSNLEKIYALYKDIRIDSSRIDFDLEKQIAQAQGEVVLSEGDVVLTGSTLQYDFKTETGGFIDAKMQSDIWFGKAAKVDKKAKENLIELNDAYITTCDAEKPHYRLQAKRIKYYIDDRVVAKNALMFVNNIPILYFPYWSQPLNNGRANPSISVGHKKEWGGFIFTTWRYDLNQYLNYKIHADHRQLKGFASGIDVEYDTENYGEGTIKTYYMNERDKYEENNSQEKERYRGQLKHRWQADKSTLALLEYNKLSDIDFTKDYLYREYAEDIQPITEGSITHYEDDYSVSFYARKRTNRFYSEVERLPELEFNTVSKEIADSNFYLRHDLALANLNKKIANRDEDTDANRFDTYNELKYPTKLPGTLAWINISPYVGTRQTYYSKDNNGDQEDFIRGIHYYGFDMNTKFFRIYDYKASALGIEINKLRHIITPSVKYTYIHSPTVSGSRLGTFDSIDSIYSTNTFTFGLENHFQTKWKQKGKAEMENIDLIYFYPYVNYMQNAAPGVKHFGFINSELNFRPNRWLHVDSDTVFNQYQKRFNTANIDLYASHEDKWKFGLGKRYDRDTSEQLTTDIYYKINEKWQVRAYTRYLSYADSFQEQQYTIYRDLHCWQLETTFDIKLNDDGSVEDRTLWLIFRLKAFPEETPIRFNVGYETTNRI